LGGGRSGPVRGSGLGGNSGYYDFAERAISRPILGHAKCHHLRIKHGVIIIAPMESKKCPQCSQIKPISCFGMVTRKRKTGTFVNVKSWCVECRRIKSFEAMRKKRSTPEGLEAGRLATQRYREKIGAEGRSEVRAREKVVFEGVEMTRREKAEIKLRRNEERRQKRKALADAKRIKREEVKHQKLRDQPWTAQGLSAAEKFRLRYALDPEFNIKQRLRAAMRRKRQGYKMGDLIRGALKRGGSTPKFEDFVGYSTSDLKVHLEAQFTKGMNWESFARGEIHIDHIVPLSSFDLSSPDDLRRAWAITNLRPLWAEDNLKKSSKRIYLI